MLLFFAPLCKPVTSFSLWRGTLQSPAQPALILLSGKEFLTPAAIAAAAERGRHRVAEIIRILETVVESL